MNCRNDCLKKRSVTALSFMRLFGDAVVGLSQLCFKVLKLF